MGEGRRPWWVLVVKLTSSNVCKYVGICIQVQRSIRRRRKETYIGEVASWGQGGLGMG